MEAIFFLAMRRMRVPLLALVCTYSVAVLGLVLIPGVDVDGNPWRMSFFHAFYFVSFMASTIGFGEIPYAFTEAQRLWVIFTIYSTVVVWIYSIGTLIGLVKDSAFQRALTENRFTRRIHRLREGFYLVCGYGETGSTLVRALTDRDRHAVVLEIDEERVGMLQIENLRQYVPVLCGDAGRPHHLMGAGLEHSLCQGVVALTDDNEVNLMIAITSKLLRKDLKVICRADSQDVEANMASFGTDHIINPLDTFALYMATAFQSPGLYLLQEWFSGMGGESLKEPVYPPCEGLWVVCGFGRFGKKVLQRLEAEGVETVVIEAMPEKTGLPEGHYVVGRGTEVITLQEAGIDRAVGLVAGTDNDLNNLSIIMTARELNPDLFVVVRQNLKEHQAIIDAVQADMVMHASSIVAHKIHLLLGSPLLSEFMNLALFQDDAWACELASRVIAMVEDELPAVWEVPISEDSSLAVTRVIEQGKRVTLGDLLCDPLERGEELPSFPLLLIHNGTRILMPERDVVLDEGDRVLFCGHPSARPRMEWVQQNEHVLSYILTGDSPPQGAVWALFRQRSRKS